MKGWESDLKYNMVESVLLEGGTWDRGGKSRTLHPLY